MFVARGEIRLVVFGGCTQFPETRRFSSHKSPDMNRALSEIGIKEENRGGTEVAN
jgi:hypothetical protein